MNAFKIISILIPAIILLNCSTSTENGSMAIDKNKLKDSCCIKDTINKDGKFDFTSEITCPNCGHKKNETMPTDICVIIYKCEKCNYDMHPKVGDCCVYCTFGTHKCPSMQ